MDLYILRHGEAGTRVSITLKDSERALTIAGRKEVVGVSKCLRELNLKFDKIITSPLKRAHETAQIVSEELGSLNLEDWNELKPEGSRADLYKRLAKFRQDSTLLICGHEPYLSTMISELIGGTGATKILLKKCGIARVRVNTFVPKPSGELRWLLTPRILKKMR